jgi:hypothetical protein
MSDNQTTGYSGPSRYDTQEHRYRRIRQHHIARPVRSAGSVQQCRIEDAKGERQACYKVTIAAFGDVRGLLNSLFPIRLAHMLRASPVASETSLARAVGNVEIVSLHRFSFRVTPSRLLRDKPLSFSSKHRAILRKAHRLCKMSFGDWVRL